MEESPSSGSSPPQCSHGRRGAIWKKSVVKRHPVKRKLIVNDSSDEETADVPQPSTSRGMRRRVGGVRPRGGSTGQAAAPSPPPPPPDSRRKPPPVNLTPPKFLTIVFDAEEESPLSDDDDKDQECMDSVSGGTGDDSSDEYTEVSESEEGEEEGGATSADVPCEASYTPFVWTHGHDFEPHS